MLHFRMCNILQFTQNSLVAVIPYLLTAMLCDDTINFAFVCNVFCFNGFNRFAWFNMGRITKDKHCLIKTIKTENITHKHNTT